MTNWSVYNNSNEIRRYKSKAAAVKLANKLKEAGWDVFAHKTFSRDGILWSPNMQEWN